MKTSLLASIPLFALFCTTLLSTMFVIPLVLASRYTDAMTTMHPDAPLWERYLDGPAKMNRHDQLCLPRNDGSVSGPADMQGPVSKSGPDAAMIRSHKARAKTIKV